MENQKPISQDPTVTTVDTQTTDENLNKNKQDVHNKKKKSSMATRGLKSLTVMIIVPLLLTLVSTVLSGACHSQHYAKLAKHTNLLPPVLALSSASLLSSLIMGLSAWLVWADGGFHRRPRAFQVYLAWLVLNVAWNPVVVGYGASKVGLVLSSGLVGAVFGCWKLFKEVEPSAGNLVLPCFALSGLLALVNAKLVIA